MLPMFNVIYIYLTCPFAICKQVVVSEVQSSALFKIASLYFLLNHSSNGGGGSLLGEESNIRNVVYVQGFHRAEVVMEYRKLFHF